MATKIRLSRRGRKKRPFYHIIVADARHPRDGRFIEQLGTYNPIVNPAEIQLNFARALYWLNVGAKPTQTCRAILSYKGVLLKKHLLEGVKKGSFDEETADVRFKEWELQQENKIQLKKDNIVADLAKQKNEQLAKEIKINQERAKKYASQKAKEIIQQEKNEETAEEPMENITKKITEKETEISDKEEINAKDEGKESKKTTDEKKKAPKNTID